VVSVVEVDLSGLGVQFPPGAVGMVLSQPFLQFTEVEPIVCLPARKQKLLDDIGLTLNIAQARHHRAEKTHFTVIPECCLPGLDGVAVVDQAMSQDEWPCGTIVIGGVDGLSRATYAELLQGANTNSGNEGNAATNVRLEEWVNCCITWVKATDGQLHRWVQPKLAPAWVELNRSHQSMFRGQSIFVLRPNAPRRGYRFGSRHYFVSTG
jgi:hypothetical protein